MAKLAPLALSERLIYYDDGVDLICKLDSLGAGELNITPCTQALRIRHVIKEKRHYFILFNEEKTPIEFTVTIAIKGKRSLLNPYTGAVALIGENDPLQLSSHEAIVMTIEEKTFFTLPFTRSVSWFLPFMVTADEPLLVFSACDSNYLGYAISLIRSLDVFSPGFQFLLHIVNPSDADLERLKQLSLELVSTRLSVSVEHTDLSFLPLDQQKTYYACVRFLRLAEILSDINKPVLCLDADSLIVNPIDFNFSDKTVAQLCLIRRDVNPEVPESLAVANGSIWLDSSEGVQILIKNVAQEICCVFANSSATWGLDQVVMGRHIKVPSYKVRVFNIKRKYADWDFHGASIIWAGKGSRKYMDMRYYLLQRLLEDNVDHQRQAAQLYQDILKVGYKGNEKIKRTLKKNKAKAFSTSSHKLITRTSNTNVARWEQNALQKPSWDKRVKLIAALILPGSSVLDVGAGAMTLADYLAPGSEYTPLDVVRSSDQTVLADFNSYQIPDFDKLYDVVVCSGVMEYIVPVDFFMSTVSKWSSTIILSYAIKDLNGDIAGRERCGWLNHFSEQELREIIARHGLTIKSYMQWEQQAIYVIDSSRTNRSIYYTPNDGLRDNDVASVFRYDTSNVGDFYCPPFRYCDLRSYRCFDIVDIPDVSTLPQNLIIGGGGLLGSPTFNPYFDNIFSRTYKTVVGWGLGENSRVDRQGGFVEYKDLKYPDYINRFDLLGVRDFGTGHTWVPCASCLHPIFYENWPIHNEVVIFEHKRVPINIDGFPKMNNDTKDILSVIRFLGTAQVVITNSYHAAYWSQLMGKAVLVFPFSSKFYFFKHKVTLGKPENWKKLLDQVEAQPPALQECIEANLKFNGEVQKILGQ